MKRNLYNWWCIVFVSKNDSQIFKWRGQGFSKILKHFLISGLRQSGYDLEFQMMILEAYWLAFYTPIKLYFITKGYRLISFTGIVYQSPFSILKAISW
jgi:hypothetical protein